VPNHAYGCGLVHRAAGLAVPALLKPTLHRGANAALKTTRPTEWYMPSSHGPVTGVEPVAVTKPIGATALDIARSCHDELTKVEATSADFGKSLRGGSEGEREERRATLRRYRRVIELLESSR
jgi:hypothetical protein